MSVAIEYDQQKMKPTVSIVTPCFNRAELVAETLDSVIAQTETNWELIAVDDGSTDRTKDVIASYAARDSRIRLYDRQGEPKGACTCRNEGVELSRGEYLVFLDTDDLLESFCLQQRVVAIERDPSLDFAIFPSLMFKDTPHDLGLWWNVDKPEDELARQFKQDAICQGTGAIWRKASFVRIGMWDASLLLWQDIDLFLRAFIQDYKYTKRFDLPADLHNRVNPKSLSRSAFHDVGKQRSRVRIVQKAVALLESNGKSERKREARFMTAEIISGAARTRVLSVAFAMLGWGLRNRVLNLSEGAQLALLIMIYTIRATKFDQIKTLAGFIESNFSTLTTIGTLPVAQPGWNTVAARFQRRTE